MSQAMAAQIAQLLVDSDLKELEEIVRRWVAEAPDERSKHYQRQFGAQLIELKRKFSELPTQPRREDLEAALGMMLQLAAQRQG